MRLRKARVVLDTNILVSGILFKGGNESKILRLAADGHIDVFISIDILREFVEVISRPRFQLTAQEASAATQYILSFARLPVMMNPVSAPVRDHDDMKFLQCIREARAEFLVTGDKDLLVLRKFNRALILTPSSFLQRLKPSRV